MFLNLTPYLTWLGIMLTSKPNDLQNRINALSNPNPSPHTPPPTTTTTTTTKLPDFIICTGRPVGRYPHPRDCTKFYVCARESSIAAPSTCPTGLYFSPTALVCTLPQDSGCLVASSTTVTGSFSPITLPPPDSAWVKRIESSNYYRPVNEDRLVIYFDHNVNNPENVLWPISFIRNLWESIILMYGRFGVQNRLYVVLRGSHLAEDLNYSSYLDSNRSYVNSIEVGTTDWSVENSTITDLIARNMAQIVSKNARGIRYSGPEPNWADIFVYDFYQSIGRSSDGERWATQVTQESESNLGLIPLFSQWYLTLYRSYGGGSVLNRFLILREQNFPKAAQDNSTFARTMNRGEFVHFWSGTTGTNLSSLASSVFGWSDSLSAQYQAARAEFSTLNY